LTVSLRFFALLFEANRASGIMARKVHRARDRGGCLMTLSIVRGIVLVVAAAIIVPGVALAQETAVPPASTTAEAPTPAPGPSLWLVGGITTLAFSYAPAALVGATSGLAVDRTLFIPVLGPWIDLTQRPSCSGGACSDKAAKELLVIDGALQAASLAAVLFGLVSPPHESATAARSASLRPTIRVSPAPIGSAGHGMVAVGTF